MSLSEQQIKAALSTAVDPNTGKDFVAGRAVKNIKIDGGDVSFDIELAYPAKSQIDVIRKLVVDAVRTLPGVGNVSANVFSKIVAHSVQLGVKLLPGVKTQNVRRGIFLGTTGTKNHRNVPPAMLANIFEHLIAADVGKIPIDDEKIEIAGFQRLDASLPLRKYLNLISLALEKRLEYFGLASTVLYYRKNHSSSIFAANSAPFIRVRQ